jgi:flavin-dependent dehydrogenase
LGIADFARYVTLQDYCVREGAIDPVFDCFWFSGIKEFGIGYVIPKDERVLVGLVYYPGTKSAHVLQDRALERLRRVLPIGASIKREAWIAPKIERQSDVATGRGAVLLAGEAGGFISPTSGEGISWALTSGRAAGKAIAAHAENAHAAADDYAAATAGLRRDIARRLRWYPAMNSRLGKTFAGFVPASIVSHFTHNL